MPTEVLRAPRESVVAYLRAAFDAHGGVDGEGVVLTSPDAFSRTAQLLLLHLGILSEASQSEGGRTLRCTGAAAATFEREVGFGSKAKQAALASWLADRRDLKAERWEDEVVSTEAGVEDVYDISVTETHRYAAGGLIHHNS